MVRNVIFDLGGVVLDWNPDAVLASYYDDFNLRTSMKAAVFQHPDWLQLDRGTLSEDEAVTQLEKRTNRPKQELIGLFEAVRHSLRPKPDTMALVERLAHRGVPLYCLSNMPEATFAYLCERYSFWARFRGVVISGKVKMMKPEREIFEYLLNRYELAAAATVFIDDHLPNIVAADALGLHTIWFRDAAQCDSALSRLLGAE